MADSLPETSGKFTWKRWLGDMRIFNEFIKARRRDKHFPVLRFRRLERNFLILSVFSVVIAMLTVDHWYIQWIRNADMDNQDFFRLISPLGNSSWVFILSGILVLLLTIWNASRYGMRGRFYWQRLYHKVTFIFLSVLASGLLTLFMKNAIGRIRPKMVEDSIYLFKPFSWHYQYASFPSGHAATFGTLVFCIILLFPRARLIALCVGTIVPFSRLMVEAHFPSDVLAGYLLGIAVSWYMALYYCRLRVVFRFDRRGRPILRKNWKGNWKEMLAILRNPKY